MLKALGFKSKKSKPPTEEQLRKYGEQKKLRDQWRYDTASITSIIDTITQKYGQYKGDFALARYEELKTMIKEAVANHKELEKTIKARTDDRASAIAAKYLKGGNAAGGGEEEHKTKGISHLTKSAASFAVGGGNTGEKSADELTSQELEDEVTKFRKELLQMKQDFRSAKEKLEKLDVEYQNSKKQNPPQRYQTMKDMIKNIKN